jgi:hypothetical protein
VRASPNIFRVIKSRKIRLTAPVARREKLEMHTKFWSGNLRGKHRRTWEDNIRMDLREIGWEDVDWMRLNQDKDQWRAAVDAIINFLVP